MFALSPDGNGPLVVQSLAWATVAIGLIAAGVALDIGHGSSAVGIVFGSGLTDVLCGIVLLFQSRRSIIRADQPAKTQRVGLLALLAPIYLIGLMAVVIAIVAVRQSGNGLKVAVYLDLLSFAIALLWLAVRQTMFRMKSSEQR